MHRLFVSAYLRTLQKLNTAELSPATAQELLAKVGITASGEELLFKMPRDELKHALNVPCPINSLAEEGAEAVIASSKLLRHHVGYEESKMCLKCPLAAECKSAKLPWDGQNKDHTMRDLLIFFNGLAKLGKPEQIYYRQWVGAYKLQENIVAAFEDLVSRPQEIKEYDQLRIQAAADFQKKLQQQAAQKAANL